MLKRMMVSFHQNAGAGKLTGVLRKYSTFKFGYAAKAETALFLLGLWQCSQYSLPMEGVIAACNWEHNYSLLNTFWAKKLQCLVYSRSYPIHLLCLLRFWMKDKPGYFFERSNKIYFSLLSAYLSSSFVAAEGWKPDKQHILIFDWNCSTLAHKRSLD